MDTATALSREWLMDLHTEEKEDLQAEFSRVALPHISNIYRAAVYFTKDGTEAEDLVQETYLKAFRFFDKFERGTNCKAWLTSILRNLFLNHYQKKSKEPQAVDQEKMEQLYQSMVDQGEAANQTFSSPFFHLMDDEVTEALGELHEECRTTIVLVDMEGLSYQQAAEAMGCAIGTVRSRVSRGRRILQARLREYGLRNGLIKESSR